MKKYFVILVVMLCALPSSSFAQGKEIIALDLNEVFQMKDTFNFKKALEISPDGFQLHKLEGPEGTDMVRRMFPGVSRTEIYMRFPDSKSEEKPDFWAPNRKDEMKPTGYVFSWVMMSDDKIDIMFDADAENHTEEFSGEYRIEKITINDGEQTAFRLTKNWTTIILKVDQKKPLRAK